MTLKVGINGFGRIGRNILRAIIESGRTDIEVVAINDLGPVETNAHLMRYDSVHGKFPGTVTVNGDTIDVGRGPIKVTAVRDPKELPWANVDIALHDPHINWGCQGCWSGSAGTEGQARWLVDPRSNTECLGCGSEIRAKAQCHGC